MAIAKSNLQQIELSELKHVRDKPGMYIGSTEDAYQLYREIRDNANDEVINGFANTVKVTINKDGSLTILDNGRGLPIETMQMRDGSVIPQSRASASRMRVSGHYGDTSSISSGTHGVGQKVVNALSDWYKIKVWKNNKFYEDAFEYNSDLDEPGIPTVKLKPDGNYYSVKQTLENSPELGYHGTEISFKPSEDRFESTDFDFNRIVEDLHKISYINPNATYIVTDISTGETVTLHESGGIASYAQNLVEESGAKQITSMHEFEGNFEYSTKNGGVITKDTDPKDIVTINAKIAMCWTNGDDVTTVGFTNTLYNKSGGTHIDGFLLGVSRLFNNYAKKFDLSKTTIDARDLRQGLVAVVSLMHTDPFYNSQTKDKLIEPQSKKAVNGIVYTEGQFEWDKFISEVEDVIKQAKFRESLRKKIVDLTNDEINSKSTKAKLSKKLKPSKKLRGQPGVVSAELYITEGDSASTQLIKTRLNGPHGYYQGIMPIKGKIINVIKASKKAILNNEEVQTILSAIGSGINDDYDESKLRYDKIIVASDSDPDGDHILTLVSAVIYKYCPQLITNGHFFRAMAPLYENTLKDKSIIFSYTESEQEQLLKSNVGKNIKNTQRYKGLGEMTTKMTRTTLVDPTTRKLFKYTTDDIESAYKTQQMLLSGDIAARKRFIMENANFAELE